MENRKSGTNGNGSAEFPSIDDFQLDSIYESKNESYWPCSRFEWDPLYRKLIFPHVNDIYRLLSSEACRRRTLVVEGAQSFLADKTGFGTGVIKRGLQVLRQYRLIRMHKFSQGRQGNCHFVEPLLIGEPRWKELLHLAESEFYAFTHGGRANAVRFCQEYLDLKDPSRRARLQPILFKKELDQLRKAEGLDLKDPRLGSYWPNSGEIARTRLDLKDPQIYFLYSLLLDDAQRYPPLPRSEGGADDLSFGETQGDKGVLTDRITPQEEKGVGRKADKRSPDEIYADVMAGIRAKAAGEAAVGGHVQEPRP